MLYKYNYFYFLNVWLIDEFKIRYLRLKSDFLKLFCSPQLTLISGPFYFSHPIKALKT